MDSRETTSLSRNLNDQDIDPGNSEDLEIEERLADWLETNRVENSEPIATLYKFVTPEGAAKTQVDYFRGVIPSRHDIGLEYGSGKYVLFLRNQTSSRGGKMTSVRFSLHESYDEKARNFKREKVEKDRLALGQSIETPSTLPAVNTKDSFLESFNLVRAMQADTLAMFRPLLEKLLTPAAPHPAPAIRSPFDDYTLSRQIMKDSLKENMSMISMMQKNMLERPPVDTDEEGENLPDEKQTMFDRIIAIAEPFINILSQNSMAAKIAGASIKAAPQFKEVIRDATLARRIIKYVEHKEGPERAAMALKNLGIAREDYSTPDDSGSHETPSGAVKTRSPAPPPATRGVVTTKKGTRTAAPAGKVRLNPKMEVKNG